ncbi:MAG: class I SAM-dependent methyltransferase, partial [Acidobacteriota bacterium]|nr:class I SAM-dependent methyltransferase [Acidobacteriota bacterium]
MVSSIKVSDLYDVAGIEDVPGFYRDRFFTGGVLEAGYFDSINRFDIQYARTMWIYDNVRRGSSVLDLGCGEGMLALLKRKGVTLAGVDLSPELLAAAGRNGYDGAYVATLTALPFPDSSFDYVVSLDVMGHVAFDDKDRVLAEIKRVLRPDGVTMHGIECLDRELHQDYDKMSEEQLRHFVNIDGHIGLEDDNEHASRFRSLFSHVQTEPRYTLCLSSTEFLKQADEYGVPFEADFLDYLRGLSFTERRAFDMAMGYVFGKISDLGIRLPKSGLYMFLKASAAPLGPFYNAHRDRSDLFGAATVLLPSQSICLDRSSSADFDSGWYAANDLPPIARWMAQRARIRFQAASLSRLSLDLTTHMPDLR